MPEELVKPEELSKYRQVASHVVSHRVPASCGAGCPCGIGWAASVEGGGHRTAQGPQLLAPVLPFTVMPQGRRCVQAEGQVQWMRDRAKCRGGDGVGELCGSLAGLGSATAGFDVVLSAQGLHSASIPGILALDLCPADTNKILTGESRLGPAGQGGEGGGEGACSCSLHGLGTKVPSSAEDPGGRDSFLDLIWVLFRWGR